MKLRLDENVPEKLKIDLFEHQVWTVPEKGWSGLTNGTLLKLLIRERFDALITFDRSLQCQQNLKQYAIAVLVLVARKEAYFTLADLIPDLKKILRRPIKPGCHIIQKIQK